DRNVNNDSVLTVHDVYTWFEQNYPPPLVQTKYIMPQLLKKTVNHPGRLKAGKYDPDANSVDDLFYSINPPVFDQFQLYQEGVHDPPLYPDTIVHERELQRVLTEDPGQIEPGLRLIGANYPAAGRFIDLFYSDRDHNLLVVELKVSRAYDRVVGQLLRYMGWVKEYHAERNQQVRGLIIGDKITQDLVLAVSMVPNVECKEYDKSARLIRRPAKH
ncbi:MAG TPA: endonuclease NucS domain-containing protein, partial [Candidatus Saccharimonadales bacterium]|nr:endonuclease NucS domain-containing protein [Candidatus Saccharimonadales bacterium]